MHFTTTFVAAVLAVSTVSAIALPVNETNLYTDEVDETSPYTAEDLEEYCNSPGQPCDLFKRTADAVADAEAHPWAAPSAEAGRHKWCFAPGQACGKAKRSALAMAEAVASAYAEAMPNAEPIPEAGTSISCP